MFCLFTLKWWKAVKKRGWFHFKFLHVREKTAPTKSQPRDQSLSPSQTVEIDGICVNTLPASAHSFKNPSAQYTSSLMTQVISTDLNGPEQDLN